MSDMSWRIPIDEPTIGMEPKIADLWAGWAEIEQKKKAGP